MNSSEMFAAPTAAVRDATAVVAQRRDRLPRRSALVRGLLGWVVLCLGLGLSGTVSDVVVERFALPSFSAPLLFAGLMSLIIIPIIVVLRRRLDKRSLASLGWSPRAGRPLLIGVGVGAVTALIVWLPAVWAGWIRVDSVDIGAFVTFLAINGIVLALAEAIPEELALRGYVWTNFRDGWGLAIATIATTALFPVTILVATSVGAVASQLVGDDPQMPSLAPNGQDVTAYFLQLIVFGLALVAARRVPLEGALFVAVAFHWTQLTVNRTVLGGSGLLDSGWTVTWVQPDAIALVLVHSIVAGIAFITLRIALRKRQAHRRSTITVTA